MWKKCDPYKKGTLNENECVQYVKDVSKLYELNGLTKDAKNR